MLLMEVFRKLILINPAEEEELRILQGYKMDSGRLYFFSFIKPLSLHLYGSHQI